MVPFLLFVLMPSPKAWFLVHLFSVIIRAMTTFIAIYAALVASIALGWNIFRERRRIKIRREENWGWGDPDGITGILLQIGVRVTNNSRFPIEIEEVGVIHSDKTRTLNKFADIIQPGLSNVYWLNKTWFRDRVPSVKYGYAQDSTRKTYKTKISHKLSRELDMSQKNVTGLTAPVTTRIEKLNQVTGNRPFTTDESRQMDNLARRATVLSRTDSVLMIAVVVTMAIARFV